MAQLVGSWGVKVDARNWSSSRSSITGTCDWPSWLICNARIVILTALRMPTAIPGQKLIISL